MSAGMSGGRQTSDALHRLVCKGWIETAKLLRRSPSETKSVAEKDSATVSATLLRQLESKLASGETFADLRRGSGVEAVQVERLRRNPQGMQLTVADRLCNYLKLSLSQNDEARKATLSETLRQAIVKQREAGASLNEICRAADLHLASVRQFLQKRKTLNLKTVDGLCGILGLGLMPIASAKKSLSDS